MAFVLYLFYIAQMNEEIPDFSRQARVLGRGASSNAVGRFEPYARASVDDGWALDDLPPLRTEVALETARKIITKNSSPDLSFDRSINPYRGCEHGCIYCFARPSHAYLGLSPGLDFETRLTAKPNAAIALEKELSAKSYRPDTIAIGTNTDPYQPIEKDKRIMREVLEVLAAHNHPVAIVTKGTLIERDIDILAPMAAKGLVRVGVSVTSLNPVVSRKMEPRCPAPARRLRAIEQLTMAGIPVRLMASPMVPALTDHELEAILESGRDAGAVAASWIMLRLPREVADLFATWARDNFPDRAERILGRVRELHGGALYDPEWGKRMTGTGEFAELMKHRFKIAARRLGLDRSLPKLRTDLFEVPAKPGDQLSLF